MYAFFFFFFTADTAKNEYLPVSVCVAKSFLEYKCLDAAGIPMSFRCSWYLLLTVAS